MDTTQTIQPGGLMGLNDYQAKAVGTAIYPGQQTPMGLIYCALKMTGEAGEFSEKVGKAIRDDGYAAAAVIRAPGSLDDRELGWGEPLTDERREAIAKELGDVLWYVAAAAAELGLTLGEVGQMNLDKLAGRAARGTLMGSGDER